MTDHRSPPPPAETCLVRSYASRAVKGGTLIAEAVTELAMHLRHLALGTYRPPCCPVCGAAMHVHDYPQRRLRASSIGSADVVRFRCADRTDCGAVFRVLPAFIARHLWRAWDTVEEATRSPEPGEKRVPGRVPSRTVARWVARLATSGMAVVVALASSPLGATLAETVGLDGSRAEVVAGYAAAAPRPRRGQLVGALAGLVHRAAPGIRLV